LFLVNIMGYQVILLLLIAFLNFIFGLLVFVKNKKSLVNISYAGISFFLSLWTFGMMMYIKYPVDEVSIFLWSKILYLAGSLVAVSFLFFAIIFPDKKLPRKIVIILLFVPILIIFYLLFFTNLILKELIIHPDNRQLVLGKDFLVYYLEFFIYFAIAFYYLFKKYFRSSGITKLQLRYILIGTTIPCFLSTMVNMIFPLWGDFRLAWTGPVFLIFLLIFIAYAIIRYRLMDIRMVARRAFIYLGVAAFTYGIFYLIISVVKELVDGDKNYKKFS